MTDKFPSELRFDLVSKDWVIIATGRGKRPEAFKKKRVEVKVARENCPFCNLESQEPPVLILLKGKEVSLKKKNTFKDYSTIVIPNKYPALFPHDKLHKEREGEFYQRMNAVGFCELVVTKDHEKHFPKFSLEQTKEVFDAYQKRYLSLMNKKFVNYISIFHNHGAEAGASQPHPHSQIITTPLIDVDLKNALFNSAKFYKKHRKCIYCEMNKWEREVKKRVVFENKLFMAVCPFASKSAFQIIISPKKHLPYFERITEKEKHYLAEAFLASMKALFKGLSDPAYNFYLHTAPCDGKKYPNYHWHWTILPKTAQFAGFEIGTRMEISTIEPEQAALYLKRNI